MSSDNFYLIRRANKRYAVSMEFASSRPDPTEENPLTRAVENFYFSTPIDSTSIRWFDTHVEALSYANSEYSEYAIQDDEGRDYTDDTLAARTAALLRAGSSVAPESLVTITTDLVTNAVILDWGNCHIRIEGPSASDTLALSQWLSAVNSVYAAE